VKNLWYSKEGYLSKFLNFVVTGVHVFVRKPAVVGVTMRSLCYCVFYMREWLGGENHDKTESIITGAQQRQPAGRSERKRKNKSGNPWHGAKREKERDP